VRVDSGVAAGSEISGLYDPMIAKLIVYDTNRETARRRMLRALSEFEIGGVKSLLGFHQALLTHTCFIDGETCHGLVESEELAQRAEQFSHQATTVAAVSDGLLSEVTTVAEVDGRRVQVKVLVPEPPYRDLARRRRERAAGAGNGEGSNTVVSPMQGTVLSVKVAEGDVVEPGHVICIIEAMKMENEVTAHRAGTVSAIAVAAGQSVTSGQAICVIESDPA
jgi:acetyl-CoA/propionyl-CoA carboxylase biotin carboxyl carrier protein